MDFNHFKQTLRNDLINGQPQQAIDRLLEIYDKTNGGEAQDEVIVLAGRLKRLRDREIAGILSAEMAQAKGETGLRANISGSFGLSQTGSTLGAAYKEPLDQERLTLSLQIPIIDWGKTKARLQTAQSNLELTTMQVEQERINFERNILLKVQQFNLVRDQVILAAATYEVAQKRNNITRERYLIGKIGITDLNLALSELENARRNYISALEAFWMAYYELRLPTLYDFAENRPLIRNFEVD
jgi:hypothetical protein